jgi:hypothetical protein
MPRLDSFGEDGEDDGAVPLVVSARRGSTCGDGMVEVTVRPDMVCLFVSSLYPCVKKKKKVEGDTEEVAAAGGERG